MKRIIKTNAGNWLGANRQGLWPADQVYITDHDKKILRELAATMKALSEEQEEERKIKLWTAHNDLLTTEPVILCDPENGWNEILSFEKDCRCEGVMAQDWEMWLRQEIVWNRKIKDDKPIGSTFYLPYHATDSAWGIEGAKHGDIEGGEAYSWDNPITDDMMAEGIDLSTLVKTPVITVDKALSRKQLELAEDVFAGILDVQFRHRWWWSLDLSLSYSNLRGLTGLMLDFYDYPEKVHEMMELFTRGYLSKLDFLEEHGLLMNNVGNTYVASGGLGFTNDLQKPGTFDPARITAMDIWGFNEAQETSETSPDMFAEFILPYQIRLAERFGLNCYGCCEPLHHRWEHVKKIPRLRRVSVSPWSDMDKMSEFLKGDYIYSYKASPTPLATPEMDEETARKTLRNMLETTSRRGNIVEIHMKDNHTLGNNPNNAYRWVEIAREEIARVY